MQYMIGTINYKEGRDIKVSCNIRTCPIAK